MNTVAPLHERDAYTQPRRLQPGCTHQLGCRCDPPYWLRPSTEIERLRERLHALTPQRLTQLLSPPA